MPKDSNIQKVLVIGSGPVVIGQAAEFDYAGTQACIALKEEGIKVILVNNNPATIMTDETLADEVYLEPLTVDSVTAIIKKERPDGLLPTLGGQTGLNLAVQLSESGVLEKYNVKLLGTSLETIQKGENREIFKATMKAINEPVAESITTTSVEEAIRFADQIGFPIIVRPAYTLGGAGGGIANHQKELKKIAEKGIQASPIQQILVEQSVKGWKEIEFEIMRDQNDTCIVICNMENMDPVGVHTGDSIVVAPSQTLKDRQYQMLRDVSFKVIRSLGVVGGCNIQFALHPETDEYVIIEVNPRVSRSSALASKATGYPIARIAAKLALGYHLDELYNPITGNTVASFEPTMDYIAVKIPRWPFDKFPNLDRTLDTQMMATGEVMALARNFPQALQKAVRSLENGLEEIRLPSLEQLDDETLKDLLRNGTDVRLFAIAEAFRRRYTVEEVHQLTNIAKYFLNEIKKLVDLEKDLTKEDFSTLSKDELQTAKEFGFSNQALARLCHTSVQEIENRLKKEQLQPIYKMVDTCAGEFPAKTPYYYSGWKEFNEVESLPPRQKVVVLGSGPIRIGQGIEFDYCSVHAALALKKQQVHTIVINNNPETVSTDIHIGDHLYFEPLTEEDVLNVIKQEKADGVFVQFGGQTAINLAKPLNQRGIPIMGTSIEAIHITEDRHLFYQLLRKLNIPHIPGLTLKANQSISQMIQELAFPILVRPSFVIGGMGMEVLEDESQLLEYINKMNEKPNKDQLYPLLIDTFIAGDEFEVDVVCDGEDIIVPGIFEHVEKAGIHSGDSMAIFPAPSLTKEEKQTMFQYAKQMSTELQAKGLMNIQFVRSKDRRTIYVLEVNPRASRTVPITSKVTGVPIVELATKVQLGQPLRSLGYHLGLYDPIPFYAIKMPIFSSRKLKGMDPILGPDMKSTGEIIGIGKTLEAAIKKAFEWQDLNPTPHENRAIYLTLSKQEVPKAYDLLALLTKKHVKIYTNKNTAAMLKSYPFEVEQLSSHGVKNALENNSFTYFYLSGDGVEETDATSLRQGALATNTIIFSSIEMASWFFKVEHNGLDAPLSIQQYLQGVSYCIEKERVLK